MDILELKPLAEQLFADIGALTFDGVGITRDSYGPGESAAADHLRRFAGQHGLDVRSDRAANLVFALPDEDPRAPAAWVGSHVDSVPQGGNFDGLAGIVAGLLCLIARKAQGGSGAAPLRVIAFRGEESAWFGKAYMGSGAALGKLGADDLALKHRSSGKTLADCMAAVGADVEAIAAQQPLFDRAAAAAYLELHIEQGPVMVARKLPLAVVPGIRGNIRHNRITCLGEPGHSGAVPRWLRKDAMFAVAELITRLDEHWKVLLERGMDLVVTTGVVSTDPAEHSISRIPGKVEFSFEVRSKSVDTLEGFYQLLRTECKAISRDRGVHFEFDRRVESAPATMDPALSGLLRDACAGAGLPTEMVPSGAGHDAALFANAGIPTAMLFVRNEHGSHNPDEAMDLDDFMLGTQVMYRALAGIRAGTQP
ncbi:Allantoate amidohydrolase [Cupriavidus taiwanensis]|uniref:hydantoinase/carbamoylase family amidase n=1 Tax=Cupriavidus taiwanensis TaxID=164546 RepID=UPI000E15EDBB|nr:hydantoinase/carbamoylase family amidase [Cupriavidus taiwanensis]SOY92811.1 Allantoate amidohydrolase [Cupriavidus taiwanensis]SOY97001.1 Allantoate amidohydrolase [Cupriavidus taiwanensis]